MKIFYTNFVTSRKSLRIRPTLVIFKSGKQYVKELIDGQGRGRAPDRGKLFNYTSKGRIVTAGKIPDSGTIPTEV